MRNVLSLTTSVGLLTLMMGCAAQPPAAPIAAAPVSISAMPVAASGGIDGVYHSATGRTAGNSRCGTTRFGYPIRVTGGVASMQSVANGTLEGPVAPDGSLMIEKGRASLRGQFANGEFNGAYGFGGCSFTLAYVKR